jgi:hypothetical protein
MSSPAIISTREPDHSRGPVCPKCGGAMWDNRATKRNPKAPDYKCRDRSCDGVLWPGQVKESPSTNEAEQGSHRSEAPNAAREPASGPLASTVQTVVHDTLRGCYLDVTRFVLADVRPLYEKAGLPCTDSTIAAIAATLFISLCRRNGREAGHE